MVGTNRKHIGAKGGFTPTILEGGMIDADGDKYIPARKSPCRDCIAAVREPTQFKRSDPKHPAGVRSSVDRFRIRERHCCKQQVKDRSILYIRGQV